jgi:hypothetical protein
MTRAASAWTRGLLVALLVIAALGGGALQTPSAVRAEDATPPVESTTSTATTALAAASAWLRTRQGKDGGFLGYSGEPDPGVTTDAVLALYAAGDADQAAAAALASAIDYLEKNGADYAAMGAGQAAKLAMAAVAGGRDPREFAGMNLIAVLEAPAMTPVAEHIPGICGNDLYDHALVILALAAAGEAAPADAIAPFRDRQGADGGWAYDGSTEAGAADSNTTALVIQALAASRHGDDEMVQRGLTFLKTLLVPDGTGFAFQAADPLLADANSTAMVLQALLAVGEDPTAAEWGNVPQALAKFQTADGGLRYMANDEEPNLLATVQGIPALAGRPLPVASACGGGEAQESDGCVHLAPAA